MIRLANDAAAAAVQGLDLGTLIPYVTGAGGALVVLLAVLGLFISDKVTTVASVERLRESDHFRYSDMAAQRDALVRALERANDTTATATKNAQQSLELLHETFRQAPLRQTP